MLVNTSELSGAQLDQAVAKCEGIDTAEYHEFNNEPYMPSVDWAQAGPIIEREGIALEKYRDYWVANPTRDPTVHGPTPLIAAMRCYVASKLGDEVEV